MENETYVKAYEIRGKIADLKNDIRTLKDGIARQNYQYRLSVLNSAVLVDTSVIEFVLKQREAALLRAEDEFKLL